MVIIRQQHDAAAPRPSPKQGDAWQDYLTLIGPDE
jgi:hypothetical protein